MGPKFPSAHGFVIECGEADLESKKSPVRVGCLHVGGLFPSESALHLTPQASDLPYMSFLRSVPLSCVDVHVAT